jgi:hypothetical protein
VVWRPLFSKNAPVSQALVPKGRLGVMLRVVMSISSKRLLVPLPECRKEGDRRRLSKGFRVDVHGDSHCAIEPRGYLDNGSVPFWARFGFVASPGTKAFFRSFYGLR